MQGAERGASVSYANGTTFTAPNKKWVALYCADPLCIYTTLTQALIFAQRSNMHTISHRYRPRSRCDVDIALCSRDHKIKCR